MTRYIRAPHDRCPHQLRIELDGGPVYRDAAPVVGRVIVVPAFADTVYRLAAELQLHVHGHVNAVAVIGAQELFRGPLHAGAAQSFAFSLPTPKVARAYYGKSFNMELRVAAVLLRPSGNEASLLAGLTGASLDELLTRAHPAAVCPVSVASDDPPIALTLDPQEAHARLANRGWKLVGAFAALLVAIAGVVLAGLGGFSVLTPEWAYLLGGVLGAFTFAVLGAMILQKHLSAWFAERRIGIPVFSVHTTPGSHVDVMVQMPEDDSASDVHAAFLVIERYEDHSGSGVSVHEHIVRELPFALGKTAPKTWGARLPITAFDDMPSVFGMDAAQVRWDLQVSIALPNWPDWTDEVTVDAHRDRLKLSPSLVFCFD